MHGVLSTAKAHRGARSSLCGLWEHPVTAGLGDKVKQAQGGSQGLWWEETTRGRSAWLRKWDFTESNGTPLGGRSSQSSFWLLDLCKFLLQMVLQQREFRKTQNACEAHLASCKPRGLGQPFLYSAARLLLWESGILEPWPPRIGPAVSVWATQTQPSMNSTKGGKILGGLQGNVSQFGPNPGPFCGLTAFSSLTRSMYGLTEGNQRGSRSEKPGRMAPVPRFAFISSCLPLPRL